MIEKYKHKMWVFFGFFGILITLSIYGVVVFLILKLILK